MIERVSSGFPWNSFAIAYEEIQAQFVVLPMAILFKLHKYLNHKQCFIKTKIPNDLNRNRTVEIIWKGHEFIW